MSRLTDQELEEAFDYAHGSLRMTAALSELRERRAADLTARDVEALLRLRNELRRSERGSPDIMYYPAHLIEARKALDKLLAREVGR